MTPEPPGKAAVAIRPPALEAPRADTPREKSPHADVENEAKRNANEERARATNTALRERVLMQKDPHPTPKWMRISKNLTVSGSLTTCVAALIGTYVLPNASVELLGAVSALSAFALLGIGRWAWEWVLGPTSAEIKCLTKGWVKTWRINSSLRDGIIAKQDAITRKRELLDDYLQGKC
jgi:hypothetical protein